MRVLFVSILLVLGSNLFSQSSIKGLLKNDVGEVVSFANVALYNLSDSTMVKVETTDASGTFHLQNIKAGNYFLKATFVGMPDLVKPNLTVGVNETLDLKLLNFAEQAEELKEFEVSAERSMVEVKPDRTIFNVQGTINSVGSDALTLLKKAPSVSVDNQDNINVLGRSGVRIYIDGKQLPLAGDDLNNYLKNLPADQIDRIEIITNPGAKYDAEGNAGIVDIRLKKDKSIGANGSLSSTYTQGELARYNVSGSGNYRNKKFNVFGTTGTGVNDNFHNINFENYQNGLYMDEINNTQTNREFVNYRLGTDFFLHSNHTIGFLIGGMKFNGEELGFNRIAISDRQSIYTVDSILVANNVGSKEKTNGTYNINYRFFNKKRQSLNLDFDYGNFQNKGERYQPNTYYAPVQDSVLTEVINAFETPTDIKIYSAKADFETTIGKGQFGIGAKYSRVETNNTFKVFDVVNGVSIIDDVQSNLFNYEENVYAGYLSFSHPLGKKWNFIGGLRAEQTNALGSLTPFQVSLQEDPVVLDYLSWFPSAGLTYKVSKKNTLVLNYGRRINRPDYNVLNPFRTQLSELSAATGNPFLNPEIVNNYEIGYTVAYKYNFKVAYSRTDDKITRLIGPDPMDPRAGFVSWDNLATETVMSFSAGLPVKINKWWNMFANLSANHINNQADYGNGAVVDVQNYSYTIFQQHTFKLFKGVKGEVSGYYSGPGVWGGVFKYDPNWTLNAGLQKEFFKKKLKARVAANNIFNQLGWKGTSSFDGLVSAGNGRFDNRFVSFSLNYNFGNQNIKSRKRKSGLQEEEKRVGG